MATRGRDWTFEELESAIALYLRTSFGRLHQRNPDIVALASRIDRTPSSVAMKMANLASIDETLDRKGLSHATERDRLAWKSFFKKISNEASLLPSTQYIQESVLLVEEPAQAEYIAPIGSGTDFPALRSVRQGQQFFREIVLTSYENRCAITGISQRDLLVAGHIRGWADDAENRMNPRNGLCLNRLHDRAFESGFIGLEDDGRVLYSRRLSESDRAKMMRLNDSGVFTPPKRFAPDPEFIREHRNRFDNWTS